MVIVILELISVIYGGTDIDRLSFIPTYEASDAWIGIIKYKMIIIIIMLTTMTAFTKLTLEDANHTW